jgi:hypothetical protein
VATLIRRSRSLLLLACLLSSAPAWAACSGTSPNLTAPTWADVAACHTAAQTGDTITVSPGTYTVTAATSLNKAVTLRGPGVTLNFAFNGNLLQVTESAAGHLRIEGLTINRVSGAPTGTLAMIWVDGTAQGQSVLLTGNTFNQTTTGNTLYFTTMRGVIWDNAFNAQLAPSNVSPNCWGNASALRVKAAGNIASWEQPPHYGRADAQGTQAIYFEHNTITTVEETIDCDDACRIVIRFNTFKWSGSGGGHGVESGVGARTQESYNNTMFYDTSAICKDSTGALTRPANTQLFISHNGTGFWHHNALSDITSPNWGAKPEYEIHEEILTRNHGTGLGCWGDHRGAYPGSYPGPHQAGWGYTTGATTVTPWQNPPPPMHQDLEPSYLFANTGKTVNLESGTLNITNYAPTDCTLSLDSRDFLQENRELYAQIPGGMQTSATSPFDGTHAVGYGPRALRPGTCTKGVAYWATDGGTHWDTTSANATDGGLDWCDATNHWTPDWYVPLTYPHPLASGTPPAPEPSPGRLRLLY